MFEEGVKLLLCQVGLHLGGLALTAFHLRATGNGVQLNGFLTLGDGSFKIPTPCGATFFATYEEHGQKLRVVILMPFLLGIHPFFISGIPVVVGVIPRRESVPHTRRCRILFGGTRQCGKQTYQEQYGEDFLHVKG